MTLAEVALLNASPVGYDPGVPEEEHFVTCGTCGQTFDLRRLGDVCWHEQEAHERLPVN